MGEGPRALTGLPRLLLPLLATLLVLAMALVALCLGPYPLAPGEALQALARGVLGGAGPLSPEEIVVVNVRLPRVAAALIVGGALAAAGATYQGLFRNPLVSPDILGVSAGASVGAALGIFWSLPVFAIQGMAFAGGIATVSLVYLVAVSVRGREPVLVLVLAGVVVGALAGALVSLLKILADPYDQLPAITFWLLGTLSGVKMEDLATSAPIVIASLVPLVLLRWRMNVLSLGDDEARALGVEAGRLRLLFVAAATLMTASVVAVAGVVGWVGLVMPHVARMLAGPSFARMLPLAILLGGGYLLLVDTLARTLATTEVPLGILTAFVGAPFFLYLLARGRQAWA